MKYAVEVTTLDNEGAKGVCVESIVPLVYVADKEAIGLVDIESDGEVPFVEVVEGERDTEPVISADAVSKEVVDGLPVPIDEPLELDEVEGECEFVAELEDEEVAETERVLVVEEVEVFVL